MKWTFKILFFALFLQACAGGENKPDTQALADLAEIKFEEDVFDFGTVPPQGKVTHVFTFTNTSENPLVISKAKASCGCTVPSYPEEPVEPGETGEIEVTYNAASTPGEISKTVTIVANTYPAKTILTIKGFIKP